MIRMTKAEAIKELKLMRTDNSNTGRMDDALKMAIEALESLPNTNNTLECVKLDNNSTNVDNKNDELIRRGDAIRIVKGAWARSKTPEDFYAITVTAFENILPFAPSERKVGRWIRITQGAIPEKYMCPFCHRTVEHEGVEYFVSMMYPFCHCGADMRGE